MIQQCIIQVHVQITYAYSVKVSTLYMYCTCIFTCAFAPTCTRILCTRTCTCKALTEIQTYIHVGTCACVLDMMFSMKGVWTLLFECTCTCVYTTCTCTVHVWLRHFQGNLSFMLFICTYVHRTFYNVSQSVYKSTQEYTHELQ